MDVVGQVPLWWVITSLISEIIRQQLKNHYPMDSAIHLLYNQLLYCTALNCTVYGTVLFEVPILFCIVILALCSLLPILSDHHMCVNTVFYCDQPLNLAMVECMCVYVMIIVKIIIQCIRFGIIYLLEYIL